MEFYLESGKIPSEQLSEMKDALNKKRLLPNQYMVDELIKEYGSLNAWVLH